MLLKRYWVFLAFENGINRWISRPIVPYSIEFLLNIRLNREELFFFFRFFAQALCSRFVFVLESKVVKFIGILIFSFLEV